MAVYKPHTLFTMGGVLNSVAPDHEIWQCGIRLLNAGKTGPLGDHPAFLASITAPLKAWWASAVNPAMPISAELGWIKANPIGADGKYTDPTTHLVDFSPATSGTMTGASALYPDVLTVAISWMTDKAIRRHAYATHGRIYLPTYGNWSLAPGGVRIDGGVAGLFATKGAALLSILAGAENAVPIIASAHNGEVNEITGVRVGDVYDVQRRRKDALKENYSQVPWSSG